MDIGWCARIDHADRVKSAGLDFIEVALAPMRVEDDLAFQRAMTAVARCPLPMPVFCQFLPRDMTVVGPDVDQARVRAYLARSADVMQAAGAEWIVFGSGWARNVPDGWGRDRATAQFLEMVMWCREAFQDAGVKIALESQNRTETNFMTTLAESVVLAKLVDQPDVRVIADTYHLHMESEPFQVVERSLPWIVHLHVSDSERRLPGDGVYDFGSFFAGLYARHYRYRLSIEMMTDVPEEAMARTAEYVRRGWDDVSKS